MALKNEKTELPIIKTTGAPLAGCATHRLGMVLTALRQRLAENPPAQEAATIEAEIEAIEEQMGF